MTPIAPIFTAHLFPTLDRLLEEVLRSLAPEDWERPTLAPLWRVKDLAAHLLDGNLRALSMLRDGYFGEKAPEIHSYADLVQFLNQLNADWVRAFRRVSPAVLVDWLVESGKSFQTLVAALPPFDQAAFSVAWAGEETSLNWFHIAREYTEKWHHQQQIRQAVGQELPLYASDLYQPYLATSMRALPHHYSRIEAEEGSLIEVTVPGDSGGTWCLQKGKTAWSLWEGSPVRPPQCQILLPPSLAWRLFTKGIDRQEAAAQVSIAGNHAWGEHILTMLAVMA